MEADVRLLLALKADAAAGCHVFVVTGNPQRVRHCTYHVFVSLARLCCRFNDAHSFCFLAYVLCTGSCLRIIEFLPCFQPALECLSCLVR